MDVSLKTDPCVLKQSLDERRILKNYIIRIYRQEEDNPRKIVGVVEEPEIDGKKAFTNLDELWQILNQVETTRYMEGGPEDIA